LRVVFTNRVHLHHRSSRLVAHLKSVKDGKIRWSV